MFGGGVVVAESLIRDHNPAAAATTIASCGIME